MWYELVEMLPAHEPVKVVQEVEALLVWNRAEGILGVDTLVVDDEFCELVRLSKQLHRILCAGISVKLTTCATMYTYLALSIR